ncbi:hypothetical protein [Microbacterium paraoxydans]|uniref:hypothetical protein n=1 Tax=Microbacterium paraoxydans TaxID=199592 RepID=UPI0011A13891|nr:hypothetical protein [Microbacterium paraoxydans]
MSEQSPQPPTSAPPKPWHMKWWVWLIAAALVVGGVSALINPNGGTTPSAAPQPTRPAPTESTPSETLTQSDVQVIYGETEAINRFIVAFNKAHPTDALATGDLIVYNHHGRNHEDQVQTQISGADVVISEDNFSNGAYGVSVVGDNPPPGAADGNVAVFRMLRK